MTFTAKQINLIGWIGSSFAIVMFLSNLDQARLNLAGQKGSVVLPIATVFNCVIWSWYAYLRKDWPLFWCNLVGIFAGLVSVVTYFW